MAYRRFSTCIPVVALLFACSADDEESGSGRGDPFGLGGNGAFGGMLFGGGGAGAGVPGGGAANGGAGAGIGNDIRRRTVGDSDCIAEVSRGELVPLDIFIMFDLSCSMSCHPSLSGPGQCCGDIANQRLNPVRSALSTFLNSPDTAGINVGLGYFGHLPLGETSCDPAVYATPIVDFGPLPGHAAQITSNLDQQLGVGETPTGAALRGACTITRARKAQFPSNIVVTLLVTDGYPEVPLSGPVPGGSFACATGTDIFDAQNAAAECTGSVPQIPTYVLGVGANLSELQMIAQGGGTQQAYLVESGDPAQVADQVLGALNSIRDVAGVPCEFQMPPPPAGETLNFQAVNVEYSKPDGTIDIVYGVDSEAQCDPAQPGWFYQRDASGNPTGILLCPNTCSTVENTQGGQVDIAVGCGTIKPPA